MCAHTHTHTLIYLKYEWEHMAHTFCLLLCLCIILSSRSSVLVSIGLLVFPCHVAIVPVPSYAHPQVDRTQGAWGHWGCSRLQSALPAPSHGWTCHRLALPTPQALSCWRNRQVTALPMAGQQPQVNPRRGSYLALITSSTSLLCHPVGQGSPRRLWEGGGGRWGAQMAQ
uniref:Uncharacterized protein n=1 Tax=Nomascus leucogenys TaxID=61853 RepID=A0A2I3H879_NOMLE